MHIYTHVNTVEQSNIFEEDETRIQSESQIQIPNSES